MRSCFYLLLISIAIPFIGFSQVQFSLTNPLSSARQDELIILSKKDIIKKGISIKSGEYVALTYLNGVKLVTQFDDLDGDGKWDELVFLQSFKPNETIRINAVASPFIPYVESVQRAHVRHQRKLEGDAFGMPLNIDSIPAGQVPTDFSKVKLPPFLTEGPAWENDKLGFRIYFDVRNTKDIWGKKTSSMVLGRVGLPTEPTYHEEQAWGMDVLKVGKSLGAGALALQVGDSLVRLGGVNMGKIIYQKIADGPVRAIFRLNYPNWVVSNGLKPVQLTEEISIWGGQYFSQSKVWVKNAPAGSKIVTGIVNLKSKERKDVPSANTIYTFDKQSENNDMMGMAVMVAPGTAYVAGQTPNERTDVTQTYTVSSPVGPMPFVFRFYVGWEKSDPQFTTAEGFEALLSAQGLAWKQKIQVK